MAKKKTLLIIPVIFIITILISLLTPMCVYADDEMYEPRLTAPSQSIPYYSTLNTYAQTGTPMPNCVAYAFGRVYEMNGEKPLITHGNAGEWWGMNIRGGYYPYGQTPKVGAVACWSGHVAVVEKVNNDGSVTLSESHWGGTYFDVVTYQNMGSHYGQSFYGFIYTYNNGMPQELRNKLLNTDASANVESVDFSTESKNAGLEILDLNTDIDGNTNKKVFFLSDKLEVK